MGGKAFAQAAATGQPSINVQRLDATEYQEISRRVYRGLQALFPDAQIIVPASFSDKHDFGDADILLSTQHAVDWNHVATALGAKAWIDQGSSKAPMSSLAISLDSHSRHVVPAQQYFVNKHVTGEKASHITQETYGQVDVSVVPHQELQWRSFCSSYSDIGLILGRISKRFGFRIDTRGLSVEMKDLDAFKTAKIPIADREGTIFLSADPAKIMSWLHLDVADFERGFSNSDAMFAWLDSCRFLAPSIPLSDRDDSRDQARASSRPVFAAFMARQAVRKESGPISDEAPDMLRAELLANAVEFFGKKDVYQAATAALARKWSNAVANECLKELLSEVTQSSDKSLLATLRGFRRFVTLCDGHLVILEHPLPDEQSQLHRFLDDQGQSLQLHFCQWAKEHHMELTTLGKKPMPQKR